MISPMGARRGRQPTAIGEAKMAEEFIVVWTIDDETMSRPHTTQEGALQQAGKAFARARMRSADCSTPTPHITAAFHLVQ
jgi:hypothetical protein